MAENNDPEENTISAKGSKSLLKAKSRLRGRLMEVVESIVDHWIKMRYDSGIAVTDALIKGAAIVTLYEINDLYDHNLDMDTTFSNGWLRNFKKVKSLSQYTSHGESRDVDLDAIQMPLKAVRE
ncbi:hypothetical protein BGZ51_009706 [Haplosporangium sp. Z 767]|nr:hypothetical protein BGZ51_009706 [Haplosporangium sp. Z 767]